MLPTYQRINVSNASKIRSFRASEKILIFLVFVSFLVIVLFGFFLLPDFASTNTVSKIYREFGNRAPEIFIPAPPVADKPGRNRADEDKLRLWNQINSDVDLPNMEKPELEQKHPKVPIAPIPVPHHQNAPDAQQQKKSSAASQHTTIDASLVYQVDGADQDPVAKKRRDKVKEVS